MTQPPPPTATPPKHRAAHVPLPSDEVITHLTRRLLKRNFRVSKLDVETVLQTKSDHLAKVERALTEWDQNPMARQWLAKQFGAPVNLPADTPAADPSPSPDAVPPVRRVGCHVYAASAAASLELSSNPDGLPSLFLDAALTTGQARSYDWANKITVMLSQTEALQLFAVLIGRVSSCKGEYHGVDRDKGFTIEDQGGHLFLKLTAAGVPPRALPVNGSGALAMADVCTAYLQALRRDRSLADWISLLDLTLVRLAKAAAEEQKT